MKSVALITGASSGLGKEFAYIHASNGKDVVLVARRKEKLEKIKLDLEKTYNTLVYIISKDLTDSFAIEEICEELKEQDIKVEYLINNAGFGGIGKFNEREIGADSSMIALNIGAVVKLTRLILPEMILRKSGKILNVSSTAGLLPGPNQATYFATKSFITSWSYALSQELSNTGVSVTTLLPGATETEFGKVSGMDKTSMFQSTAPSSEVAQDGYTAMMQGKMSIISGVGYMGKVLLYLIPFIPKKFLMRQIEKAQSI